MKKLIVGLGIIMTTRTIFAGIGTLALAVALAACGGTTSFGHPQAPANSSQPNASLANAYLDTGSGWVNYIQWNTSGSGSLTDDTISGTAPDEQISSDQTPITVYVNGSEVTFDGLNPQNGTLANGTLALQVLAPDGTLGTDTFAPATQGEFNQSVAQLQAQVQSDNNSAVQASASASQATSVSQAQQSLGNDATSLGSDTSTLNNDTSLAGAISQMKTDYQAEQSEWQTVQADSCSSMGGDADDVGGDAIDVGGDLDSEQGDVDSLQGGDIQAVQTDLTDVQNDLSTLQGLGATPGTSSSAAIAAGNKALTSASNAISWANGQANTINSNAQGLATTATNYANVHCGS
jgi:hypothetical protein